MICFQTADVEKFKLSEKKDQANKQNKMNKKEYNLKTFEKITILSFKFFKKIIKINKFRT